MAAIVDNSGKRSNKIIPDTPMNIELKKTNKITEISNPTQKEGRTKRSKY